MPNLHQLLAVKKDVSQRSNEIAGETKKALGSKHLFTGSTKSYKPFDEEDDTAFPDENEQMSYTVADKLTWFAENFGRIIDIEYQIDRTNSDAVADLEVADASTDTNFYVGEVPATFLLDLIGFLDKIRKVYSGIPVLDPKHQWEKDPTVSDGVFKTIEPEVTYRSKKVLCHKVLYEATEEHPAQIEKWPEDRQVGKYTKKTWSGAFTAAQKAMVLGRIDKLLIASKKALSEANNADHDTNKISDKIFRFIHAGVPTGSLYHEEDL